MDFSRRNKLISLIHPHTHLHTLSKSVNDVEELQGFKYKKSLNKTAKLKILKLTKNSGRRMVEHAAQTSYV